MFHVKIVTPKGLYEELDATILNVVTPDGMRGILSNHMPLVTMIDIGRMSIGNEQSNPPYRYEYATGKGTLYFKDNYATVLVDTIEKSDDIDLARAQEALQRAEERLHRINDKNIDMERARRAHRRAKNRIKIKTN